MAAHGAQKLAVIAKKFECVHICNVKIDIFRSCLCTRVYSKRCSEKKCFSRFSPREIIEFEIVTL